MTRTVIVGRWDDKGRRRRFQTQRQASHWIGKQPEGPAGAFYIDSLLPSPESGVRRRRRTRVTKSPTIS